MMKPSIKKALEEAEVSGADVAQLKQLKAMLTVGMKKPTKKYPTKQERKNKQKRQKDARKANRGKK